MTALPTNLLSLLLFLAAWFLFNHLIDERNRALFEVSGLREAARISGEMLADRDENDRTRTKALNHALSEINDLRRAVDGGSKRLFVKATCNTPKPAPAAWLMQAPPNSQQTLDRIISPSEISSPSVEK